VTVRATDFTFCDLVLDFSPWPCGGDHIRHIVDLVTKVIEVEDERI
jgi:hypothetical protein